MIEILKAIVLGLVQGLTEFLPVSSSGHLTLLELLGMGEPSVFFNIMLHVGTLFAAAIALFRPIIESFKSLDKLVTIAISCIPTFIIAIIAKLFLPDALEGAFLGVGFLITAVVLVLTESLHKENQDKPINYQRAFLVGVMQGIAVLPGISRSGMTIGFLRGTGVDGKKAAEYSFLIGMPVILGGALFEIIGYNGLGNWSIMAVVFGMIAAFFSGLLAIRIMLKLLARKSLLPFAAYVTVLAVISFIAL